MVRVRAIFVTLGAAASLAGCTMLDGYGGVSVGYGDGYDPYYDSGYYGDPYYGWYEDYYYPGIGAYVYDRGGRRHGWSDRHRRYWEARRAAIRDRRELRENWSDYRRERREEWRDGRGDRGDGWRERRDGERDGNRDGWRERRDGERDGNRDGWRERRDGRPDGNRDGWRERRDGGRDGGADRREFRADRRGDAPSAAPTVGARSDEVRSPRPQVEARPEPQAIRPEPRQERVEARTEAEVLAPRQPE